MKIVKCDKCGKEEAYYFMILRDPFTENTREQARSLKCDLCKGCAKEVADLVGIAPTEILF